MSQPQNPPPGWYPDPAGQGSRYWDGVRWTTHIQPAPAASPPMVAAPVAPGYPPAPGVGAVPPPPPPAPGYSAGAPAPAPAVAAAASGQGLNAFIESAKRLEPFAVMVIGAVLFLIATLLPWAGLENLNNGVSDSVNGWSGDGGWLILGASAEDVQRGTADGSTDLLLLLPLAIIAIGVVVMARQGKKVNYGNEIAAGASGLLTLLLIIEIVHVNGVVDDIKGFGNNVDGGAEWGLFIAVAAAGIMTFGAVRGLMAAKGAK